MSYVTLCHVVQRIIRLCRELILGHRTLVLGCRRGERTEEDDESIQTETDVEIEPTIRIRRATLTQCPLPPDVLDGWLKPGWQNAVISPAVLESRNFEANSGNETTTVSFSEDEERVNAFNE